MFLDCAQNSLDAANRNATCNNISSGAYMIKSRLKSRLCIDNFVHLGSKILSLLQIVGAHVSAVKEEMLSPQVMFAKDLNRWSTWPGGNMFLINFETAFELERCHIPGDSADH